MQFWSNCIPNAVVRRGPHTTVNCMLTTWQRSEKRGERSEKQLVGGGEYLMLVVSELEKA